MGMAIEEITHQHCDICTRYPDVFWLGYQNVMVDSKPVTVADIQRTTSAQDRSGWWTAYYHGREMAKTALKGF
jgi:hypothetical protein